MDKNLQSAVDLIHNAAERFGKQLPAIEKKLLDGVLNLTKGLEVKNGNIVTNTANLKLINSIKNKLNRAILNKGYLKEVGGLTDAISKIKDFQDNYYTDFGQNVNNKLLNTLKQQAVDGVVEGLAGQGLVQNVSNTITNVLRQSVISGANLFEMTQQLTSDLATDGGGRLSRYAKTYATDAIGQFAGEYNKAIADDLGLEWFMYVGSNLTTTREFCEHLRKKKYVHKSELSTILEGKIDGYQCEIYTKTGLPKGMIEGTNVNNFMIRRGGYNCGHELVPVAEEAVPIDARNKILLSQKINIADIKKQAKEWAANIHDIDSQELADLQHYYTTDAEEAKKNKDKQLISEEELARRTAEIKNKQAKADKDNAIAQAVINAALAITKVFATVPWPASLILAGITAAATAIQVASIKNQPLPKYWKGRQGGQGEYGIVGEHGPEMMWIPDGANILPSHKTNTMLRAMDIAKQWNLPMLSSMGSIIPNTQIADNTGQNSAVINYDKLGKAIAQNTPEISQFNVNMDEDGFGKYLMKNNNRTTFLNKRFQL